MRVASLAHWIARTSPTLHRLLQPPWRVIKRLLAVEDPWEKRKHFNYYGEVVRLARAHAPAGEQVLDVGPGRSDMLERLDWFERRVAVDRSYAPRRAGVETVIADFLDYRPHIRFDLVLCLEVLEHLEDPAPFARKLLASGRTVIISVPYRWPAGTWATHQQDPVDEAKLLGWTGRAPIETSIVADGRERLICVYRSEPATGNSAAE